MRATTAMLSRGTLAKDGTLHLPNGIIVAEAMTPTPVTTCEASADVADLARTMTEKKIDAIPVVRGLRLVGLVTSTDLLRLRTMTVISLFGGLA